MKYKSNFGVIALLLTLASACAPHEPQRFEHAVDSRSKPWTHENFDAADGNFKFAVFSDLYGGERDGVFSIAVEQLELLQPELVLNVGDLIDGGTENRTTLAEEWDEFDAKLGRLSAPVFYIGGNHDLTNVTMRKFWEERYGARYYYFKYKNVLFLMLDSEDYEEQRMQEIYLARAEALQIMEAEGAEAMSRSEYSQMPERRTGWISLEQADYFKNVLEAHPDVRWTFLLMHKPVWRNEQALPWQSIEESMGSRPYTVINGHFHSYSLTRRLGRDYLHLGTTSGAQNPQDPMSFDHVTLISMGDIEPSIAHLRLEGILDKTGHVPQGGESICFQASKCTPD